MGILETIDQMNVSDEEKDRLRREFSEEVDPLRDVARRESARAKESRVEQQIEGLKPLFGDAPAAYAYARRILLSDDEEPAGVLLSDADLGLSGDNATGSTGKQEITLSEALTGFIDRLPKNHEGKLNITLSEQGNANEDHDRPDDGNEPNRTERSAEARKGLSKAIGKDIPARTRKRYRGGGLAAVGGES